MSGMKRHLFREGTLPPKALSVCSTHGYCHLWGCVKSMFHHIITGISGGDDFLKNSHGLHYTFNTSAIR